MAITINGTTGISGVDGSAATPAFKGSDSNTGISFGTDTVTINTGGVARVTTDASGNVGIGTVSPSSVSGYTALNIKSTLGSELQLGNTAGTAQATLWCDANGITYTNYAATSHIWVTAASEKMRLDSSGNVGIGTSSPTDKLEVVSSGSFVSRIRSTSSNSFLAFSDTGTTGIGPIIGSNGNALLFGRGGVAEYARIDSSGSLLVGATTTSAYFDGNLNVFKTGNIPFCAKTDATGAFVGSFHNAATSGDNAFLIFLTETSPTARGSINYNRGAGVTAYNTTSDYRAKDINGSVLNALATISQLKPYMGTMKGATIERPMFVAHETQAVAPYAVTGEKDAVNDNGEPVYQQMDHSTLVPLLTAAIQEQQAIITKLQADVAALKGAA